MAVGLFILNPPGRSTRPFSFSVANKPKRKKAKKGPGRGWWRDSRAHAVASKIGRTYLKAAKEPRAFSRYAASPTTRGKHKGLIITRESLSRYRAQRKHDPEFLEARRGWYKRKRVPQKIYGQAVKRAKRRFGMLYNPTKKRRKRSAYQSFIAREVRGARGVGGARRAFKAAVAKWRRNRGNPVLPYMAFNPKKRAKKSVYRGPAGRFRKHSIGKARGWAKLKREKGGWKNNRSNPTLPGSWTNSLYRLPRRYKRKKYRGGQYYGRKVKGARKLKRHGRGWRNNPVLPYMAFNNPLAALSATAEKVTDVSLWTGTILPITGGIIGTEIVAYQAVKLIAPAGTEYSGIVKHGAKAASAILLSAGVGMVTKDTDMAAKVLAGGLVSVLSGVIMDLLGPEIKPLTGGMSGLAQDLTEELKARIAEGVRNQVGVSSFVTTQAIDRAPRLGDFMTEQALEDATVGSGLPAYAGHSPRQPEASLETYQSPMADASLI